VRLHDANDHINTLALEALTFLQHFVGFPDAGGEAQVHLEPATLLLADQRQEVFGRTPGAIGGHSNPPRQPGHAATDASEGEWFSSAAGRSSQIGSVR